ncbi:protein phosphatase 1 regulatory subunit 15B-like [Rhincodon typus]|uniref:protein phosphatase 1 regulatory subunit 15B-like n=1 Tax=Rhincodon typus TaxID=259920 RepID=UPI00202E8499|nr:protein phosphatase 1 regulatory subunit 15B-like [Rhincodon typus]
MQLNLGPLTQSAVCSYPSCGGYIGVSIQTLGNSEMVRISNLSYPQWGHSSKKMPAMQRETSFPEDPLPLRMEATSVHLLILSAATGEVAQGDQRGMESLCQKDPAPTCTNPYIQSIIVPLVEQTSQSVEEDEDDWLADSEDDALSREWSIDGEDDSFDYEQEADESEANELWNSFFDPDPYNPMNFSALTWQQSRETNKRNNYDSKPCDTQEAENDVEDSFDQNTDLFKSQSSSVCAAKNRSTDNNSRKDRDQSTELSEEGNVQCPGPKLLPLNSQGCSTTTVKPKTSKSDGKTVKKVRFSPVVTVHPMIVWDFASRAARKGPWEQYARDRSRFQRRIAEAEAVISPCLNQDHRNAMWNKLAGI